MKLYSILAAMGLALTLAACGSSGGGGGGNNPGPKPTAGGGAPGSVNPVGKPGPAGHYSCYLENQDLKFTGCVDIPPAMVNGQPEQAKTSCLNQAKPSLKVVWNDTGCSQENHVGTCIDSVSKLKMRYYFVEEEKAREICQKANPQNSFSTTY